jgi:hypothetical protein
MILQPTKRFESTFKKLASKKKEEVIDALAKFRRQPENRNLRFRGFGGHPDHFLINSSKGDRILLLKRGEAKFDLVQVGTHDDMQRRW